MAGLPLDDLRSPHTYSHQTGAGDPSVSVTVHSAPAAMSSMVTDPGSGKAIVLSNEPSLTAVDVDVEAAREALRSTGHELRDLEATGRRVVC